MRYTTSMDQEMKRRVTACAAGSSACRATGSCPPWGCISTRPCKLVNSCFRGFPGVELTPSMVSNYVKKGVISHPVKKKYSREQLAALLYIVLSKNVLSLENIETLFRMQRAHCNRPPRPTTPSATRWRTACPSSSGPAAPSAASTRTPTTKSGCCGAPSSRR